VGAVENVDALGAFYRVVEWRNAGGRGEGGSGIGTSVAPVTGDENGEREAMGCGHFRRGRGEEARRLHGAGGRRQCEERRGGRGGRMRQRLASGGWVECAVGPKCQLGQ
jgi:hypothetical protein